MSVDATNNILIDKNVREEADALYKSMGMTLSSAINLFLTQSIIQGKLPIAEVIDEPEYIKAIISDVSKTEEAIKNGTATIYNTPDDLFAAWEDDDE